MSDEPLKNSKIYINMINKEYILLSPTKDDIQEIKNLCYYFWEEEGIYSENFYETILSQNLSYIYKDKAKNIIIAICLVLYEKKKKEVNISVLCVKSDYQRQGLATSILEASIDNCMKKGFNKFYLHVMVTNEKAINLYLKVGFKKCKFVKNYYKNDPPPNNDAFLMRLIKDKNEEEAIDVSNISQLNYVESNDDKQRNRYDIYRSNDTSVSKYILIIILSIVIIIGIGFIIVNIDKIF